MKGSLYPHYAGSRLSEHVGIKSKYASDQSESVRYDFNVLGYRSELPDTCAKYRVYVCGASYGIGTGVNFEETWPNLLKHRLARRMHCDPANVSVLNFSQSLASAEYITRTLTQWCEVLKPDLVIAHYSFMNRIEKTINGQLVSIKPMHYPWYRRLVALRPGWKRRFARNFPDLSSRRQVWRTLTAAQAYKRVYDEKSGIAHTLQQIGRLQKHCRSLGVECLVSCVERHRLDATSAKASPEGSSVDWTRFCTFSLSDRDVQIDHAADLIHPGPKSQEVFVNRLDAMLQDLGVISSE